MKKQEEKKQKDLSRLIMGEIRAQGLIAEYTASFLCRLELSSRKMESCGLSTS